MIRNSWCAAIVLCFAAASAAAQDAGPVPNTLTVRGRGVEIATPDTATIRAGVITQSFTASQGLLENGKVMARVGPLLRRHGIASRDVRTNSFSVTPIYTRQSPKSSLVQRITGYRVSNDVTVVTHDVNGLGGLIDVLVQNGINRIDGIGFSMRNGERLEDAARRKAVDDARRKAELYAAQAGVTLGRVLRISESAAVLSPAREGIAAARTTAGIAVEPGIVEIAARVTVTYGIK